MICVWPKFEVTGMNAADPPLLQLSPNTQQIGRKSAGAASRVGLDLRGTKGSWGKCYWTGSDSGADFMKSHEIPHELRSPETAERAKCLRKKM